MLSGGPEAVTCFRTNPPEHGKHMPCEDVHASGEGAEGGSAG